MGGGGQSSHRGGGQSSHPLCNIGTKTKRSKQVLKQHALHARGDEKFNPEKSFEIWWPTYPRRKGGRGSKSDTKKLFFKQITSIKIFEQLQKATENYATHCREADEYPKNAETWMRKKDRWLEWVNPDIEEKNGRCNEMLITKHSEEELTMLCRDEKLREGAGYSLHEVEQALRTCRLRGDKPR